MKILVTGSGGFLGRSFGHYSVHAGHQVLGLSRSSQPSVDWPGEHLGIDAGQADLAPIVEEFNPDMIFHAAGPASVGKSFGSPVDDFRAGVVSWANVLDSVRRSGRKPKIVFPSSAALYGNPAKLPVSEQARLAPISPYGFHKLMCETIATEYSQCFGLDVIIARIFSLFGPRQRRLLVWEVFNQIVGDSETIDIEGTGSESRDFLHVDDFSLGIHLLVDDGFMGVVNVGSGRSCSVIELVRILQDILGTAKRVHCLNRSRPGDPVSWQADMRQFETRTNGRFTPRALVESLSACIAVWCREPQS
jgi:UDP-glucose 4-epimerase